MKTSLSYLPIHKQEEILQIAEIIREVATPEKIILFGSYATGTWVEDRYTEQGVRYEYISDYDFLVVTKDREEKDYLLADKIVNRSRHLTKVAVNPIIHDLNYVNEGLAIGQYFFTDIVNDGVLLYDSGRVEFVKPRELAPDERKQIAEGYFTEWFESASKFLRYAAFAMDDAIAQGQKLNEAVFLLHQSAERFFNTVLLVFTSYKPKTHSLDKLRQYAKPYSKELYAVFPYPTEDPYEAHLFDLLKRGYIDARYKHDYVITAQELEALIERVRRMQRVVERICLEKIASFEEDRNK